MLTSMEGLCTIYHYAQKIAYYLTTPIVLSDARFPTPENLISLPDTNAPIATAP